MPTDDRTPNRNYQKPSTSNQLADDVLRLRAALDAIDTDVDQAFSDIAARPTLTDVEQLINDVLDGAPGALDTLNELAAALGDDPNFAATVTAALGNRYTKSESDARYLQGIPDGAVSSQKLANGAVTEDKLGNGAVTQNKIGDGAIIFAKLAAALLPSQVEAETGTADQKLMTPLRVAQAIAALAKGKLKYTQAIKTDTFSSAAGTFIDVTGLTATITPSSATSKILLLGFLSACTDSTTGSSRVDVRLARGGNPIAVAGSAGSRVAATGMIPRVSDSSHIGSCAVGFIDAPGSASAQTYSIQVQRGGSGTLVYVNRSQTDTNNSTFSQTISCLLAIEIEP